MSCFYVLSLNVFTHNKGWAEPFFPTPMSKPPGGPGGPTHPPSKPWDKTVFSIFGAKVQIYGAQYLAPKFKYKAPKLKHVALKFKYLTPNSNKWFTKNLPLCMSKTSTPWPRGARNICSRHRCLNLPEVVGDPPTPPPSPCEKTLFSTFGAKIQIFGAKIQIFGAKTQICSSQTQLCGAKIQTFDLKFKFNQFLYN